MTDAVIVEAVRTAIGRRSGKLSPIRPDDLLALTLREVVTRAGVDPAQDDDIGAGVENMSRVPMGADAFGPGEGPVSPKLMDLFEIIPQGNSAEMIARKWGFSREQLDEFAYQSHVKAGQAIQEGRF